MSSARRGCFWILTGIGVALVAPGAPAAAREWPDAARAESHVAFLEHLSDAEGQVAEELIARYDRHIAAHPLEVGPQIERCRFLRGARCDENDCPYWDRFERCRERLYADFPGTPEVRLYQLEEAWGEEAVELGQQLLEEPGWSELQLAAVHRGLAEQYAALGRHGDVVKHARQAMSLDASQDLSLMGARALSALERSDEARELLRRHRAAEASYWDQMQKVELLRQLGAYEEAAFLIERLEPPEGVTPDPLARARVWVEVGRVQEARDALAAALAVPEMQFRALELHRARFDLELEHGDGASALAAYQSLRDQGFSADPFLQQRMRLAWRAPAAPWRARDALGACAVLALLLALALLPLGVLLPVHYVGLLRTRPGRLREPRRRWGLRHAWYGLALLVVSQIPFLLMDGGLDGEVAQMVEASWVPSPPVDPASESLAAGMLFSTSLLLVGLIPVAWFAGRPVFGRGRWTLGRSVGFALVALFGARVVLGLWAPLISDAFGEGLSVTVPWASSNSLLVERACAAFGELYGRIPLFLLLACAIPFAEELIFRGLLLQALWRHVGFAWANLVQAGLFALAHEAWVLFPFLLTLGLLAGQLARRSGSLLSPMLLHGANNALAFVVLSSRLSA